MPYIKVAQRAELDNPETVPVDAGELNYRLTTQVIAYVYDGALNYQRLNDALGALEGAKLELYRRMVAPYEDIKIAANGDIPGYSIEEMQ